VSKKTKTWSGTCTFNLSSLKTNERMLLSLTLPGNARISFCSLLVHRNHTIVTRSRSMLLQQQRVSTDEDADSDNDRSGDSNAESNIERLAKPWWVSFPPIEGPTTDRWQFRGSVTHPAGCSHVLV
jgi:hypothetical protein